MEAMSITDPCDQTYTAKRNSGSRPLSAIRLVVLHDTEGGTAKTIARYFASPTAGGSAHLVVDDTSCYRCLPNTVVPWGAPGANTQGFHIEQCGYAKWTNIIWSTKHRATLERAAYKTALHCRKFGIPPYFLTADELKKGKTGVTTHRECSLAFGGTHSDPGPGWPRWWFMRRVRSYYKGLQDVDQVA
jgi:hypothetical protein